LSSVIVYSDELSFVVPPSHPLAGSKEISIRQLGAETFVAHNVPSPYRDKVIDSFRKYKTPLHMDVGIADTPGNQALCGHGERRGIRTTHQRGNGNCDRRASADSGARAGT